jgi:hypothetical protein
MNMESLKKLVSTHGKKVLWGIGLLPVAYVAWKNRGAIRQGVSNLKTRGAKKGARSKEARKLGESRKTDMVNTVRFILGKYDTDAFSIVYDRDRKRGRMGYYLRTNAGPSIFFGWSEEYEERFPLTPFWIELDSEATRIFAERGLKVHHDIYPNPSAEELILVPLTLDEMEDPRTAAGKIGDLAKKILL